MPDYKTLIDSLLSQAEDKERLANGEEDSIFAEDARNLREAIKILQRCETKGERK